MALDWHTEPLVADVTHIKKKHIQDIRDYLDLHINVAAGHPSATTTTPGFMSGADKANLEQLMVDYVGGAWTSGIANITVSAPLTTSGTGTPNLGITAATSSTPGYMTTAYAEKLDGIEVGAEKNLDPYVLPNLLPATIIDQDATHQFVTTDQITEWNAKSDKVDPATSVTDGYMTKEQATIVASIDSFPIGTVIMYSSIPGSEAITTWFNVAGDGNALPVAGNINNGLGNPFAKWRVMKEMFGRFPMCADTNYPEVPLGSSLAGLGSSTVTLDKTQIPKHFHDSQYTRLTTSQTDYQGTGDDNAYGAGGEIAAVPPTSTLTSDINLTGAATDTIPDYWRHPTTSVGGGLPHNNLPPYFPLYFIVKIEL